MRNRRGIEDEKNRGPKERLKNTSIMKITSTEGKDLRVLCLL